MPWRFGRPGKTPIEAAVRIDRRTLLGGLATTAVTLRTPSIASAASRTSLAFGLTPVFRNSDLALLERLQAYLEEATGRTVELVTRRTYQEISALLVSGQVDAAWICGYPFVQYRHELALVAVPLWRGSPRYQAYVIVDRDRPGDDWHRIEGDIHAFSDPDSNSGYLVTTALLAAEGLFASSFFQSSFYTYGHRNVVRAVASGLAQSGSVDGYVWEVMAELEPDLTDRTRVLRASEWLGFPPIACARRSVDSAETSLLREALLGMSADPLGREVLAMLRLDGFAVEDERLFDTIAAKIDIVRRST